MKLAIFASAYLASVASASLFNLRSSSSSKPSPSQFTNARVSVFGLKKAVSKEDVETISSSLIEVYNEMFAHADMQMVSFETQASAAIPMELAELTGCQTCASHEPAWMKAKHCRNCPPDDDALTSISGAMIVGRIGTAVCSHCSPIETPLTKVQHCRNCPPDDDNVATDLQAALEVKLCSTLRASGSKNLADARDCSLAFLDMTEGRPEQAQVTLKGLLHDFSGADTLIFNNAVASAYNDAFSSAGYSVGSIEAVADIDMDAVSGAAPTSTIVLANVSPDGCPHCAAKDAFAPVKHCRNCPPDDDAFGVKHCRNCPPDDDSYDFNQSKHVAQHENMEAAFKKAVCAKLQNSGSANFANVHDCDFGFVYGAVGAEAKLLTTTLMQM